ncbi:MAG: ATP-binding cassette domain-containing protein, partial [Anaeroplasmataceae bacterium]|nr:ATP-binding cassette domain-containing protein [Anaeroplasmataceae bacterium]
ILNSFTKIDEELFEQLEETMIMSDMGVETSVEICERLRKLVKERGVKNPAEIMNLIEEIISDMMGEETELDLSTKPAVFMVIGVNGAGKTTLFKILMQKEKLDCGELILGETLKLGYFSQTADWIDPDIRVIDYIKEEQSLIETLDGTISASDLLERFLFDSALQYSKVKMLSGGEKRRLQLVRVLMKNPNVLLLDEPTNDLDIYTIEILEDYIESFKGPVLVVSHDRYFLDKICNQLLVYESKTIQPYLLSFSEFLEQLHSEKNTASISKGVNKSKENKFPAKLRNEQAKLEADIEAYEEKLKEISLAMEGLTTDYVKLMEKENEKRDLEEKLDAAITRLFEIEEIKEQYKQ